MHSLVNSVSSVSSIFAKVPVYRYPERKVLKWKFLSLTETSIMLKTIVLQYSKTGLQLGGRTPYITSKNRLRTPKLHIKDVPRTSENSLVRPKMDIETSCLQKKPAHIYQIA